MTKRDEPFRPEKIEEQLDQLLAQATSRAIEPVEPEARLVQDLHHIHTNDAQSGKRVWVRLAEKLGEHHAPSRHLRILTNHSTSRERTRKSMRTTDLNTMQSQPMRPSRRPRRPFSLIAAVLVAVVLVGGVVLTFTAIRAPQQNTRVAGSGQTTLPPASVKKVAAQDCMPTGDPAWDTTCHAGLVLALNQSQKLSDGRTFALKGIYADRSQLAVWYSITPARSLQAMYTSSIILAAQGKDLPGLGAIGSVSHSPESIQAVARFDTSSLPASLQTVQLKLTLQIIPEASGQMPKSEATFRLSVPLAASRVIVPSPSQAVKANGITLTLKSVSISHLGTGFVLASSKPLSTLEKSTNESVNETPYSTLVVGNVRLDSRKGSSWSTDGLTADGNKHSPIIGAAFFLDTDLTSQHGSWTFTIGIPGYHQSWVFHVTA